MRIGELAKRAGCPVETVRYYEKEGMLAAPRRSHANYREYGPEHAARLAFILRCRSLDMSRPEIRTLLAAIERPDGDCAPVNALLDEHIGHVSGRIAELNQLKAELEAIHAHCSGKHPARACRIIETLAQPAKKRERAAGHVAGSHSAVAPRRSR